MTQQCFLIDDDLDDHELFAMALDKVDKNIELCSARDGLEALNKLRESAEYVPKYIFLDINMPRMGGLQCLPELKKLDHLKSAKVIMYSTSADEEMQRKTRQLGADDFLVKASKLSLLVTHLRRIFNTAL